MPRGRGLSGSLALVLVACFACSLLVQTEDIDAGCPQGQKRCGAGLCVGIDDPAYGCDPYLCEPCQLINAIPRCDEGACSVDACLFGFGCPTSNGCEAFVRVDPDNCGTCGVACGQNQSCLNGTCVAD